MPDRLAGPGVLRVDQWVSERRDRSLRLASHCSGEAERARWLEEAAYFQTILDLIREPSYVDRLPAVAAMSDADLQADWERLVASAPHGPGLTQRLADIIAEYRRRASNRS